MTRLGPPLLLAAFLAVEWTLPPRAHADSVTIFQCSTSSGRVIYQDTPCGRGQQQKTMQLDNSSPHPMSPPSSQAASDAPIATTSLASPPQRRTPPAVLYRCFRATDRSSYLSSHGDPQSYYAPLAMTGIIPTPLGHIAAGGKVAPNAAMVASHYVLVQDQCVPLTPEETCSALRDQYNENEQKLSRAFKSDQPPLLKREQELQAQLSHC